MAMRRLDRGGHSEYNKNNATHKIPKIKKEGFK